MIANEKIYLYPTTPAPSLEEVARIAKTGNYARVPVCMEIMSDTFTPTEVLRIVRKAGRQAFLLESAAQDKRWGRFSFVGYDPDTEITCRDGELTVSEVFEGRRIESRSMPAQHPGDEIRKILKKYKSPVIEGQPPFTGGLVGYISYDYIKYAEKALKLTAEDCDGFRDLDLMLFDSLIAFDNDRQKLILIAGVRLPEPDAGSIALNSAYERAVARLKEMLHLLEKGDKKCFEPLVLETGLTPVFSKER